MADSSSAQRKPIHSLILDTGPLIKNTISISTLINAAEELYTTPAIISEIRDEATRSRVQTTLVPFLKIRNPSPASYDAVIAFSKKTGDHAVLSRQDLGILALAYEVHCERNGGDFGLREVPKGEVKRKPKENESEKAIKAVKDSETLSSNSEPVVPAEQIAAVGRKSKTAASSKRRSRRSAAKTNKSHDDATEETSLEAPELADLVDLAESVDPEADEEGWEQPTGKRAAKATSAPKPTKFNFAPTTAVESEPIASQQQDEQPNPAAVDEEEGGIVITQEQVQEQIQDQAVAQVQDQIHEQVKDQIHAQLESKGQEQLESQVVEQAQELIEDQVSEQVQEQLQEQVGGQGLINQSASVEVPSANIHIEQNAELSVQPEQQEYSQENTADDSTLEQDMQDLSMSQHTVQQPTPPATDDSDGEFDSDAEWITPENLSEHQAKDGAIQPHISTTSNPQLDVATMTIDFAMQNVLLQMNLHLLSTNMQRIKNVNTKVLRCHACFNIVKQMDKQFCPRCGQATLQRVSCSTNAKGEFKIHLAKNYQYNKRGDKYSIPKPIAGTANTKWSAGQGGGKGGWGRDLILAEDQKEYTKMMETEKRSKTRDLMDDNYLPGILTGDRGRSGGRVKVGAGKNVNAKKRV
ncbi:hypothetical protein GMOD_00004349 [Pyrenophora seminiperda CCB06]|uniref:20S-pre-rRNA D-site endonuclease NOB1 n=1 Tax=Pyrenophora seminiperda CCB06 TaxID=1302712 RepID=A0A3M7M124_9PLEO|nr:hypothetical protein GMOD_00004349 [Pyrenophora seminiperda CCB06]